MTTIRAEELEGKNLDFWVAKAAGMRVVPGKHPIYSDTEAYFLPDGTRYDPSAGGADAVYLLAREGITTMRVLDDQWVSQWPGGEQYFGETEYVAGMRAFVGKIFGSEFRV